MVVGGTMMVGDRAGLGVEVGDAERGGSGGWEVADVVATV